MSLDPKKLVDAIKMFKKKIEKQDMVTNARDEEHLERLLKLYKDMGGKKKFESINENLRLTKEKPKKISTTGSNSSNSDSGYRYDF